MRKILIAEADEMLCTALCSQLRRQYDITVCSDGGTALELIRSIRPDALILDLMLPVMDGFYVLEQAGDIRPPLVIAICEFHNDYVNQTARDLGVSYMFMKPCQARVIASRVEHLMNHDPASDRADGQTKAAQILLAFGFNPKNDGFRFLKIGIPLFAQDPQQRVCKELYATIARVSGAGSWNQVERSIRSATEAAWKTQAPAWAEYFSQIGAAPTGKTLISRLAQILMDS